MSWSIEEHIGDCRPFPAQVIVYKGETDECMAYVSGEVADRLKAENAKLREQIETFFDAMHKSETATRKLQAENTKLRELVKDMWNCSDPCNDCPHYNSSNDEYYCDLGAGWKARRMRELGIEVDK